MKQTAIQLTYVMHTLLNKHFIGDGLLFTELFFVLNYKMTVLKITLQVIHHNLLLHKYYVSKDKVIFYRFFL